MKKFLAIMLILTMVFAFAACGGSSSEEPAADDTVYKLNLTTHDTNTAPAAVAITEWTDKLREESGGRLDITVNYNGTLAGMGDAVAMTAQGGVDLCWNTVSINTNFCPLSEITNYPGVNVYNSLQGTEAMINLYNNYDCIKNEFDSMGIKVLALHCNAPSLLSSKSVFNTVEDFKGDVIRANSTAYMILCEEFGMTQMACSVGEMYENFSKNVMNSTIVDITLVDAMKTYEIANNVMNYNFGSPAGFVAINPQVYESLPDDLKKLLDDSFEELSFSIAKGFNDKVQEFFADPEAKGINVYEPSQEIVDAIQKVVDERILETWNAGAEAAGYDAAELYAEFQQVIADAYEKYGAEYDWIQG